MCAVRSCDGRLGLLRLRLWRLVHGVLVLVVVVLLDVVLVLGVLGGRLLQVSEALELRHVLLDLRAGQGHGHVGTSAAAVAAAVVVAPPSGR